MWLALLGTIALIAVGAWQTIRYTQGAAEAPTRAQAAVVAASPTLAARASGGGAVVSSSSSLTMATSTPASGQRAETRPAGDSGWLGQVAALPALAARGIAAPPEQPTPPAQMNSRVGEPGPRPPPPIAVDAAVAVATARALEPTPADVDLLAAPSVAVGAGSRVLTPTPVPAPRIPVATPTARPATATRVPTSTPTPRPTRVFTRRAGGFPTPSTQSSSAARMTPGAVAPAFTAPPVRNGANKWGVGVYRDSNRVEDALRTTQPGVVLLMDPSEGWAKKVREDLPNAFIVGRRYKPEDQQPLDNPEKRGADFADWVAESAVPLRGVVDAWMSYNEALGSDPSQDYANYNRFQVAFAHRLQDGYGIAAIAANDGSGALDPSDYPRYFAEAIRASAFFGVHAYSPPDTDSIKVDAEFNILRYRKIHQALERAGIKNVKMVITESGLGDGFRQGIATDDSMAADFAWFTQELRKDPYMIGQAAFGLFDASGAWPRFDLTESAVVGLLPQLLAKK